MRLCSKHITSIYDAAFGENRWGTALDSFVELSAARYALCYEVPLVAQINFSLAAKCTGYQQDGMEELFARYREVSSSNNDQHDREGADLLHKKPCFAPVLDFELWDRTIFNSFPEIQFGIKEVGIFRRFFMNLTDDPVRRSGIVIHYPNSQETIPKHLLDFAPELSPHLAKAIEMNRTIKALRDSYQAALTVLNRVDAAVFILTENGHPIVQNTAARELTEANDGLRIGPDGKLGSFPEEVNGELRKAIKIAAETAIGSTADTAKAVMIKKRSTSRTMVAMISPLRDVEQELESSLSGAFLICVDPSRSLKPNVDLLTIMYGLTKKEHLVALCLAEGMSNAEIANNLEMGFETVKSHVAAVLRKANARNRAAFVWRAFQASPPIS